MQLNRFALCANDIAIFCGSKASTVQTLGHIILYIEGERFLKVNQEKTVVAYARKMKFLGHGFYKSQGRFKLRSIFFSKNFTLSPNAAAFGLQLQDQFIYSICIAPLCQQLIPEMDQAIHGQPILVCAHSQNSFLLFHSGNLLGFLPKS